MRIDELMTKSPTTCRPDDTLSEAAQTMLHNGCGCLPVTASDGSQRLTGMITDCDICRETRFGWGTLKALRVRHAMMKNIRPCHPGDTLAEARAAMREARVLHLPVVDESDQVIGLVSRADLVSEAA